MRTIALVVAVVVFAGCVTITEPNNYRPATNDRSEIYYNCYREAHQPQASATPGYGSSGMILNRDMLERCMGAKGYNLRKATTGETIIGLLTFPIWFPFALLGGTGNFKLGGGSADP